MDNDDLPNSIQTAVIGGFARDGQQDLLRPFVERYFASLTDVWAARTNETAQSIVIGLFPTLLAEQSTVDAADAWLDAHRGAAPALRRLVVEARDGVARSLHAQAFDARCLDADRDGVDNDEPPTAARSATATSPTAACCRVGGYSGVSVCSDLGAWACSARASTPLAMPPDRSPAWNAEVIVIAASPADRSSSRRRTSVPVTISTRRAPGSTATSTVCVGLGAQRVVQLQRHRPGVALEGADIDRHRQLRLLAASRIARTTSSCCRSENASPAGTCATSLAGRTGGLAHGALGVLGSVEPHGCGPPAQPGR